MRGLARFKIANEVSRLMVRESEGLDWLQVICRKSFETDKSRKDIRVLRVWPTFPCCHHRSTFLRFNCLMCAMFCTVCLLDLKISSSYSPTSSAALTLSSDIGIRSIELEPFSSGFIMGGRSTSRPLFLFGLPEVPRVFYLCLIS